GPVEHGGFPRRAWIVAARESAGLQCCAVGWWIGANEDAATPDRTEQSHRRSDRRGSDPDRSLHAARAPGAPSCGCSRAIDDRPPHTVPGMDDLALRVRVPDAVSRDLARAR